MNPLDTPGHRTVRSILCFGGPVAVLAGLALMLVGMISFFSSLGSFEPPRLFWCCFAGMPLLFVGITMCMFGFLGAIARYQTSEVAPVAKDVVNYLGENTQPGVKAVAKAVTEGVLEAQRDSTESR